MVIPVTIVARWTITPNKRPVNKTRAPRPDANSRGRSCDEGTRQVAHICVAPPLETKSMARTAIFAISAIAVLGTTCLSASAFDRDGHRPAARMGSYDGKVTSIEVGGTSVGVAGGNGTAVVVGGNAVSVGGSNGGRVVVGGDGASVAVGGNAVTVGGGSGRRVVVGGDGTSIVVGGNGIRIGNGNGNGVVVGGNGTSVIVGGNGVAVGNGGGAGVMVGGDGASVVVGGTAVGIGGSSSVVVGGNGVAVGTGGAGVAIAPGLDQRTTAQMPGFKAMALGWNGRGAWVVRSSPTLEAASADALQICNSQFGACTLSDAMVAATAFGCLVVAQSDGDGRLFAATGNSPDAAREAVTGQVAGAGLRGHIAYSACNF
jgi:hypothetical protein